MKKNILLNFPFRFLLLPFQTFNGHAQYDWKRILFLGEQVSPYAGFYLTSAGETYFITHRPGEKFLFMNLGLPS
jgi:hypothetical protein